MSETTTSSYTPSGKADSFEDLFFNSNETYIHPTSIIGPNVKLAPNVKIGPFCVLVGDITIDSGTKIFPSVTIGLPAQDVGTANTLGKIKVGRNCVIREFVTINSCKEKEGGLTKIGNHCYIMNFCHISHDTVLEEKVVLINNVNLGGHVHIENNVMLMANAGVHQRCRIGKFSCITPFSGTRQDIPPFSMFTGQPSHFSGLNLVALKRNGMPRDSINAIKHASRLYYQEKLPLANIKLLASQEDWGKDSYAQEFLKFIENSKRGVSRRAVTYGKTTYY